MSHKRSLGVLLVLLSACIVVHAQDGLRFDAVSIKRDLSVTFEGGMQFLPGGTVEFKNQPLSSFLSYGTAVRVRGIEGIPDWARTERYDVIAKPATRITNRQQDEMMRNLLIDRFKLSGHVEQRERSVFDLVLAKPDGRLGPGLKPSTLDCATSPASPDVAPRMRCGMSVGAAEIESGGTPLSGVLLAFGALAGGTVIDRTGLQGYYSIDLHFTPARLSADGGSGSDAPAFPIALQEQLGLKLEPTKAMEPVFVIDHLERPLPD